MNLFTDHAKDKLLKELPRLKIASVMVDNTASDISALLPYFETYQQKLRELGMFDLDDLQVETLRLFYEFPQIRSDRVCHIKNVHSFLGKPCTGSRDTRE